MSEESGAMEDRSVHAVKTLEACLIAEAGFFANLYKFVESDGGFQRIDVKDPEEKLRHENTFHIARLFFLLRAFNCLDRDALERFLGSHNRDVNVARESELTATSRKNELAKAIFKRQRVYKLQAYFRAAGRPAFGVTDLADLLFGQMKRTIAIKHIETLRQAGLLELKEIDLEHSDVADELASGAENSASVIVSSGQMEDLYRDYLLEIRDQILKPDEPALRVAGG